MLDEGDEGLRSCGRGGELVEETNSALPSRDIDSRTCNDVGVLVVVVSLSGHEEGCACIKLPARLTTRSY